jgi:SAM-dependent methyltransferase
MTNEDEFNSHFRGEYETVKSRLAQYVPDVLQMADTSGLFIDLGCGRGEWLDLLHANGIAALGIEQNPILVKKLLSVGFNANCSDALGYLKNLNGGSCSLISAFHILEHMPHEQICQLLSEIFRVLKPGGLFIAETPNSTNLSVASSTFWIDPTHIRPLHPEVLRFLLSQAGFVHTTFRFINPLQERIDSTRNKQLNHLLNAYFGAQDLGFVACRGSEPSKVSSYQ